MNAFNKDIYVVVNIWNVLRYEMKIFLKDMATLVERSWILSNNLGALLSFSLLLCTRTDPCSLEKNNGLLLHFDLYIVFLLFWARLPVFLGLNKVTRNNPRYSYLYFVEGPDEVPGVVLPVPGDHAAGGHHPVPHSLQTVQNLQLFSKSIFFMNILISYIRITLLQLQ